MVKSTKEVVFDGRKMEVKKGDCVLVRHSFPNTAKLSYGFVDKVKESKGVFYVKFKGDKEWFPTFLKLASK